MRTCTFDPRDLLYLPLGMFHCPECGEMVLAGMRHPDWSLLDDMQDGPDPTATKN